MLSKGTNINVIQQVLGHSDPSVTKRFYADVKDKERAEVFKSIGVIGNINQIQSSAFDNVSEFEWLPTGVCLYDFRRGNCTDGDGCFFYNCPNYITEVQFYPILKDELDLLEKEMARLKELGQEPAYQVQAVKYKYLKPLVESLEVQLNGKESVG